MSVPEHEGVRQMVADLNHLYRKSPELYSLDDDPSGFQWINQISAQDCYLSFLRKGKREDEIFLVAANFAGISAEITIGVPEAGKYKEIFNSDDEKYGGSGIVNNRVKRAKPIEWDDRPNSVTIKLAPLALSILRYIPYTEEEIRKEQEQKKAQELKKEQEQKKAQELKKEKGQKKAQELKGTAKKKKEAKKPGRGGSG